MAKRKPRDKRRPRIVQRWLFGEMTCRVGLCGRDGTCVVALPGIQFDYVNGGEIQTWTDRIYCDEHARQVVTGTCH